MTPKMDRTAGIAAALFISLILAALMGRLAANSQQTQTELLLLIQQVSMDTALVSAESNGLLQDSQALARMQQANDHNIAAYQLLVNGSVKRNLPALEDVTGPLPPATSDGFSGFQTAVSELIQSRSLLERVLQGKDALIQTAERLSSQAESLADGLEQQSNDLEHLRASYRIKTLLIIHAQRVRQAYADGSGAPALPIDALREDLKALSTDARAPASPTIRRSAANLLTQTEEHQQQLSALDEHNKATLKLQAMQTDLQKRSKTLQQQLETVSGKLYNHPAYSLYCAVTLSLISLGLAGWLGYLVRARGQATTTLQETTPHATQHPERTTPNFLGQLKTEKNLLMNDIKPIGEGILYIKADEHLESTGDLARCLNQSRESLVRRIDGLKRQVNELQGALTPPTIAPSALPPQEIPVSAEKSQLMDLTFKGHAELEGLQRRLRSIPQMDKDECKQLLIRCLKTDRILDEIRVRLKKSETVLAADNTGTSSLTTANESAQLEKVNTLVNKLVDHLDEFQTEPAKSRRGRNVTA